MKNILITIFIVITAIAIIMFVFVRNSNKSYTTETSVLGDITDSLLSKPDTNGILGFYDTGNQWDGRMFRFSELSNVSYTQVKEVKLEAANQWFSNEFDRAKEISGFKNKVSAILANAGKDAIGKTNSSIYLPIAMELNRLAKSKAQRRILIVYSDLMENTPDMSFYGKSGFELLKANHVLLRKYFTQLLSLQNLSGIEIYFIYQPINPQQDKYFQAVSEFYRELLEMKGAKVNIQANL